MPRILALTALMPLLLVATPATAAITKAEKMATCKIGADDQNLEGAKRKAFMDHCMGKGNYEPKARMDELKKSKKPVAKKPAAKKNVAVAPPPGAAPPPAAPPSAAAPPPGNDPWSQK